MILGRSLRGRLTLSMAAVLCGSVALVMALHEMEENGHGVGGRLSRLLLGDELPEPWQDVMVLAPFGCLILGLIGIVCRWSLRPLIHASTEASLVGPHRPGNRISTAGLPSEISPLVAAVNAALDRLGSAYEIERRFTMNAAHELRTPLATLSLRLQRVRYDNVPVDWPAIDRDFVSINGLIDKLLDLARKEEAAVGRDRDPEQQPCVRFDELVRDAAAQMLPLAQSLGRALSVELPDAMPVRGDAADLQDLVRNLIENALTHGIGRIALHGRIEKSITGSRIVLDVADDGPGIEPDRGDQLFERFRKGRQASRGSGLGLAIVREVARSHGGTVGFAGGANCVVRVVLPVAGRAEPALARPALPGVETRRVSQQRKGAELLE